jgi:hypothetical protein
MQILEGEKSLPVPYRPSGEVPLFIRRNGPKIQPLPIVDGHLQDLSSQQFETIKVPLKALPKAMSAASIPAAAKKLPNDVRARSGKFWK